MKAVAIALAAFLLPASPALTDNDNDYHDQKIQESQEHVKQMEQTPTVGKDMQTIMENRIRDEKDWQQ